MDGEELKQARLSKGMTLEAFGEWLAEKINEGKPEDQHVQAYKRQRVYDWESRAKAIPDKIENVLLKEEIARLTHSANTQTKSKSRGIDIDD